MDNQNESMKGSLTPRALRIQSMKDEIHDRGCCVLVDSKEGEMWVEHMKAGWKSYARFIPGDPESIEQAWETCRDTAFFMWSDFQAEPGRLPLGSRRS